MSCKNCYLLSIYYHISYLLQTVVWCAICVVILFVVIFASSKIIFTKINNSIYPLNLSKTFGQLVNVLSGLVVTGQTWLASCTRLRGRGMWLGVEVQPRFRGAHPALISAPVTPPRVLSSGALTQSCGRGLGVAMLIGLRHPMAVQATPSFYYD